MSTDVATATARIQDWSGSKKGRTGKAEVFIMDSLLRDQIRTGGPHRQLPVRTIFPCQMLVHGKFRSFAARIYSGQKISIIGAIQSRALVPLLALRTTGSEDASANPRDGRADQSRVACLPDQAPDRPIGCWRDGLLLDHVKPGQGGIR